MKKKTWLALLAALIMAACFTFWQVFKETPEVEATISVADAMGGNSTEGYLRATGPYIFHFPKDYGAHPGFRTEWWYYTGNLFTDDGRQFGYQFTIFRNQLNPPTNDYSRDDTASEWSSNQLYLAHFAITDVKNAQHTYEERFSRGAVGLAGAQTNPYKIWLDNWKIEASETEESAKYDMPAVNIKAKMGHGAAVALQVNPIKPLVLQGNGGYDIKSQGKGNASYYISFTRMATEGRLTIDNKTYRVKGQSWMDHEWSTSALSTQQKGWDWFSIQLSNGYDLMYYQLRNKDGSLSAFSTITLVDESGHKIPVDVHMIDLEVLEEWESPHSHARYPAKWKLGLPDKNLDLTIETVIPDQEMNVSVQYYEGAITVKGKMEGKSILGNGFIEMTGYGR